MESLRQSMTGGCRLLNPLMHKGAKMVTQNMVFNFDVRAIWHSGLSARSPSRQN